MNRYGSFPLLSAIRRIDNFKYLWCNVSSNLNCCQDVKQRIAMAKEAFNRKRSIFCGLLEKEVWKRLVKYFVWSVALYVAETWTLQENEQKPLKAFKMWIWRRIEYLKWTDKIKNAVVLERLGEGKMCTTVGQVAACMPIMQRARVRSPVGTGFLGEVFSGFFLTCKTNFGKL